MVEAGLLQPAECEGQNHGHHKSDENRLQTNALLQFIHLLYGAHQSENEEQGRQDREQTQKARRRDAQARQTFDDKFH